MKKFKISAMLLFTAMLMFSACGGGGGGSDDPQNPDNPGGDKTISISVINGVTPPACGETPVSVITENEQFTGTVTWKGSPLAFAASTVYTATIKLTAKSGYTLDGVADDFFTVAGASVVSNEADTGEVTASFPATGSIPPSLVNIKAILGVTAPAKDAVPVNEITETDQYTGAISWSGSPDKFAADTEYTATITLTAKSGFTFNGIAADYFTVSEAVSVSNSANSGVIIAKFSATDPVHLSVINIKAIPGVTAPAKDAVPVNEITETDQYTGTISWTPSDGTFGRKVYTATITLTAKSGYTFTGVAANFFTVAGTSTAATNSADSGVVTAVFPQNDWANYNLRDTGPAGGLIFYINPNAAKDGWKYLECAPKSTEWSSKEWGKYRTSVGGTGTAVGTGKSNTALIVAKLKEAPADSDRAAQLADSLTYGTYSDWFLPSKDELNLMYTTLKVHGVGSFAPWNYWSSSEKSDAGAFCQNFDLGYQDYTGKPITLHVRAVRAF